MRNRWKLHTRFEWDNDKAAQNESAHHGVTFDDAREVLEQEDGDIYLIESYDDEHSDKEDRYVTFGSHPLDRNIVLRISWTERIDPDEPVTRIISARPANQKQRKEYAEEIRKRIRN
jgi:uncharacterized DUF497 family protein